MRRSREQLEILQNEMRARWQAGEARSRPGRPVRQLDVDMAFILALQGMTHAEIAQHFRCDRKTLQRRSGAVLKRAAQRRALLLPRNLWQRGSASNLNLAAIEAELEAHCLNFEQLEKLLAQDGAQNNRETKYGYSRSNKQQISITGNAGTFALQKNNPRIYEGLIEQLPMKRTLGLGSSGHFRVAQQPTSNLCNLQQKFAGEVGQAKELSPELFPQGPLSTTAQNTPARGHHKNTPEPLAVDGEDHSSATAPDISAPASAAKPERRPWKILEVLW